MSIEDYFYEFSATWLNWRTEHMYETHYLILDDDTDNSPGEWLWCGVDCTSHVFELTSNIE